MSPRRRKSVAIVGGLLLGAAVLLAWTQPWVAVTLSTGAELAVTGEIAAPPLAALALAGLALAAALSLTGPLLRAVMGAVQLLIGAGVIAVAAGVLADAAGAAAPAVSDSTGIAGANSVAALIVQAQSTAWPTVAMVFGALGVLLGGFILATGRTWPRGGRRYDASAQGASAREPDAIDDWDALSEGEDPTAR